MPNLPGGALASRPLHFIWIADCSGSMGHGGKVQALNNAIREVIPHMGRVAAENPNAQVMVRAVKFSNGAQWHIAHPTPVASFRWDDLEADGHTDMGKALQLVADQLRPDAMPQRALPPVLVLISDGKPTDDFGSGLRALMDQPWGKKAVRIAIAIGDDADKDPLQRFIGHPELEPLRAEQRRVAGQVYPLGLHRRAAIGFFAQQPDCGSGEPVQRAAAAHPRRRAYHRSQRCVVIHLYSAPAHKDIFQRAKTVPLWRCLG